MLYRFGFRLALIYWRCANWLDQIPGFNDGTTEAYKRDLDRERGKAAAEGTHQAEQR